MNLLLVYLLSCSICILGSASPTFDATPNSASPFPKSTRLRVPTELVDRIYEFSTVQGVLDMAAAGLPGSPSKFAQILNDCKGTAELLKDNENDVGMKLQLVKNIAFKVDPRVESLDACVQALKGNEYLFDRVIGRVSSRARFSEAMKIKFTDLTLTLSPYLDAYQLVETIFAAGNRLETLAFKSRNNIAVLPVMKLISAIVSRPNCRLRVLDFSQLTLGSFGHINPAEVEEINRLSSQIHANLSISNAGKFKKLAILKLPPFKTFEVAEIFARHFAGPFSQLDQVHSICQVFWATLVNKLHTVVSYPLPTFQVQSVKIYLPPPDVVAVNFDNLRLLVELSPNLRALEMKGKGASVPVNIRNSIISILMKRSKPITISYES